MPFGLLVFICKKQVFSRYGLFIFQRNNRGQFNPSECFKFQVMDRVECSASKKVKYTDRSDYLLPLPVPLDRVTNKGRPQIEQVCAIMRLYVSGLTGVITLGIGLTCAVDRVKCIPCMQKPAVIESIESHNSLGQQTNHSCHQSNAILNSQLTAFLGSIGSVNSTGRDFGITPVGLWFRKTNITMCAKERLRSASLISCALI